MCKFEYTPERKEQCLKINKGLTKERYISAVAGLIIYAILLSSLFFIPNFEKVIEIISFITIIPLLFLLIKVAKIQILYVMYSSRYYKEFFIGVPGINIIIKQIFIVVMLGSLALGLLKSYLPSVIVDNLNVDYMDQAAMWSLITVSCYYSFKLYLIAKKENIK